MVHCPPASDGLQPMTGWTLLNTRPGAPASEDSLRLTVPLLVLGSLGGGGVQVEDIAPPMILEPKLLDLLVLQSLTYPPPPIPFPLQL